MAIDYIVRWAENRPARIVIEAELREYLGDAQVSIEWSDETLFARLHGAPTAQTLRDSQTGETIEPYNFPPTREKRWFEVLHLPDTNYCYVKTRQQDEYTNVVAVGFARRLSRKFSGTFEEDD